MAQAGIHGLVGIAARKWVPSHKWLALGLVLGNLLPDADNLAVAVATLARLPTEGLHRTFTHSLFFVAALVAVFQIAAWIVKRPEWSNLGRGLSAGVLMHILLDLLVWFNGVEILWPIPSWVNLWSRTTPPEQWKRFMLPVEFLFFALFFLALEMGARRQGTDTDFRRVLRAWTIVQGVLFVAFTVLAYTMKTGVIIPYGAFYLLSLGLAFGVTIRMRETVERHA